jgi:two-component system NtrC family response regulator
MTDESRFRILIVDDEPGIRAGLSCAVACDTYEVSMAADALEALAAFRERPHHLILLELKMPGPLSGLDLIRHVKDERPETLLIVVTAYGSIETPAASTAAACPHWPLADLQNSFPMTKLRRYVRPW